MSPPTPPRRRKKKSHRSMTSRKCCTRDARLRASSSLGRAASCSSYSPVFSTRKLTSCMSSMISIRIPKPEWSLVKIPEPRSSKRWRKSPNRSNWWRSSQWRREESLRHPGCRSLRCMTTRSRKFMSPSQTNPSPTLSTTTIPRSTTLLFTQDSAPPSQKLSWSPCSHSLSVPAATIDAVNHSQSSTLYRPKSNSGKSSWSGNARGAARPCRPDVHHQLTPQHLYQRQDPSPIRTTWCECETDQPSRNEAIKSIYVSENELMH